jgi:multiple sugar transport system ATP-binding protein
MASVSVHNLAKSYGSVRVLQDVSFEAQDGEFIALVGPSGCGKSTLLRSIAGLEAVNGGTIAIGGRIVNDLDPKERDAAMVFQNYALYPHMTVRQNMGFSLKLRGGSADEIASRVDEAARILGLEDYLDRYPRQLSGGQRQRVAMGRAIVRKPSVFLFDEPLSNLDAALRVQMRSEIRNLHKRLGVTSIYVTHDQVEAMTMADRIVVMQGGKVEQVGPPLELYDRPCNTFVATFIGSPAMNIVTGEIRNRQFITLDGQAINLPPEISGPSAKGTQSAKLGIRPEHIGISRQAATGTMSATVESCESTGNMTYFSCTVAGASFSVTVPHRLIVERGSIVALTFDPQHLHLFDALSGKQFDQ